MHLARHNAGLSRAHKNHLKIRLCFRKTDKEVSTAEGNILQLDLTTASDKLNWISREMLFFCFGQLLLLWQQCHKQ